MLKRMNLHRDMADVNVYTAMTFKEHGTVTGWSGAGVCDEIGGQGHLTKEDGLAAMADGGVGGMRRLYTVQPVLWQPPGRQLLSLLSASDVRAERENRPGGHAAPVHEICSQREAYLRELNRSLGRATMNLGWKNRFWKAGMR